MEITWLRDSDSTETKHLGKKVKLLYELHEKGVNVPRTVVFSQEAMVTFFQENSLEDPVKKLLEQESEQASKEIQALILRSSMPGTLLRRMIEAYEKMDASGSAVKDAFAMVGITNSISPNVAVKSSYIFPRGMALPKKQITLLNASNKGDVINAIKHCWASLFSKEMIELRKKQSLELFDLQTAVMLQEMIYPKRSGTIQINPMSETVTIHAGFGLGEAIVSKLVEADEYKVHRTRNTIESINVQKQQWQFSIDRVKGKIIKQEHSPSQQNAQVLAEKEILHIVELFSEIDPPKPYVAEWCVDRKGFTALNAWYQRLELPKKSDEELREQITKVAQESEQVQEVLRQEQPMIQEPAEQVMQQPVQSQTPIVAEQEMAPADQQHVRQSSDNGFLGASTEQISSVEQDSGFLVQSPKQGVLHDENVKQLIRKFHHDLSQLVVTCDMTITSVLDKQHKQIYGTESQSFDQLIENLRKHMNIPQEVANVRALKQSYLQDQTPMQEQQALSALIATKQFLDTLRNQ